MAKIKKQYVVIGLGRFGFTLAKTLFEHGAEVLAVDKDFDLVSAIEPFCTQAVCMDATAGANLEKLGLRNMDEAVVCIADDVEASIYICISMLQSGVRHITAKARDEKHKLVLEKIGVHNVIIPELEMGKKTALNLIRPNMIEVLSLSDSFRLVEIKPPEKWLNKTVLEIDVRRNYRVHVLALKRGEEIITQNLRETAFRQNDILLIYGGAHDIEKLSSRATKSVIGE